MESGNAEDPGTVRGDDAIWGSICPKQQEQYANIIMKKSDLSRDAELRLG